MRVTGTVTRKDKEPRIEVNDADQIRLVQARARPGPRPNRHCLRRNSRQVVPPSSPNSASVTLAGSGVGTLVM